MPTAPGTLPVGASTVAPPAASTVAAASTAAPSPTSVYTVAPTAPAVVGASSTNLNQASIQIYDLDGPTAAAAALLA